MIQTREVVLLKERKQREAGHMRQGYLAVAAASET